MQQLWQCACQSDLSILGRGSVLAELRHTITVMAE